jgi:hypothetical protein
LPDYLTAYILIFSADLLINKLLLAITLTLLAQLPAIASDFNDNPWKLR